ncbi:MAG: hypothetical protein LIQ31_05735 [Planctomycetes bacterium]|nr:hypothetical protein [Planctomycetota bacterium]
MRFLSAIRRSADGAVMVRGDGSGVNSDAAISSCRDRGVDTEKHEAGTAAQP